MMADLKDVAAEKLSREMGSWRSIDLKLHEDYENLAPITPADAGSFHGEYRYIETATGLRLFEQNFASSDGQRYINFSYSDGETCATLFHVLDDPTRKPQVTIKRGFSIEGQSGQADRPDPLRVLYVGLEPLPKALPRAVHLGAGRQLGRDCDRFLFAEVVNSPNTSDFVYWLDRATAMPLKLELFPDEASRLEGRPATVWSAQSLDEVEGRHLSLKFEVTDYSRGSGGSSKPCAFYRTVVDSVAFDRDYPRAMFRPAVTPETTVVDYVKNTIVPPKATAPAGRSSVADPIRAVEPAGSAPSLASLALAVGLAALGAGAWLRRRR